MNAKYSLLKIFILAKRAEINLKRLFWGIVSLLTPIKKNRVVFCNFMNGYTCNLKYIAEELLKRENGLEICWINGYQAAKPEEFPAKIRVVDFADTRRARNLASSARILITNSCLTRLLKVGFVKKQRQTYINTWHGSLGIKKVNFASEVYKNDPEWLKFNLKDSANVDYAISNSGFETEIYRKERLYKKNILLFGHPRNDVFFKDSKIYANKIKTAQNIPENTKIILYAPSFRDNIRTNCYGLDYLRVIENLEKAFGEKYCFIVRFHPNMTGISSPALPESKSIINATLYPDIQELLAGVDVMVTDYSSCIFDFMLSQKPAFFYAEDIEKYDKERGFYFPMSDAPFPLAVTTDELIENMLNFDEKSYCEKIKAFFERQKVFEDGHASERTADFTEELVKK